MNAEVNKFLEWTKGNADATRFLVTLFEISQVADDIADKDIEPSPENIGKVLHWAMVDIPLNPFYVAHSNLLVPLFSTSLAIWSNADKWQEKGFGFVYREILEQVITMTAFIVGGYDHAQMVANEVYEFYHRDKSETPDEYLREIK